MKALVVGLSLLIPSLVLAGTPGRFDLMSMMATATPVTETYTIKSIIDTDYKVVSLTPYHYSATLGRITEHPKIERVRNNFLNLSFDQEPSDDEYIVLHVNYGPRFIFDRNSEAICWAKFSGKQIFDNIRCDAYTTALYLIAASLQPEGFTPTPERLFTPTVLDKAIELSQMPKLQSFQNYAAVVTFLLNHVSENPEYLNFNLPGNYLKLAHEFTVQLTELLQLNRRIKITQYESILSQIDDSMANVGFRIFTALNSTINRNQHTLDLVHKHPTYTNNFYQGVQPFTLVEPDSFALADVQIEDGQVTYKKWPWFNHVAVSFDDAEPITTTDSSFPIPPGSSTLTLQPRGKRGSFAKTKIDLEGLVDAQTAEIAQNE